MDNNRKSRVFKVSFLFSHCAEYGEPIRVCFLTHFLIFGTQVHSVLFAFVILGVLAFRKRVVLGSDSMSEKDVPLLENEEKPARYDDI